MKKENLFVILTGVVIGIAALVLTALGNPANMGFCIACFERDIAGAVGLHSAAKVQYVRPEIIGLVLGSFLMAIATKEWKAKAGSSPALRFVLGAFVMIGALAFWAARCVWSCVWPAAISTQSSVLPVLLPVSSLARSSSARASRSSATTPPRRSTARSSPL